ncbi:hypothetical protein COLO4_36479 [Corchorus olitorius]|uniref:DUF7806 domain-containing protein n=1 Tax=Corchorus olitorius TaxID=93759 RepID=A0A1R3G8Q4_9ROSI|nr:hypothetical protein COLO4_36479 [Corchorus olitorius]
MDDINRDQEEKFLTYVNAAEELIQHLKNENEKLHVEVNDLRNEVASVMSSKDNQCAEYQKLLIEENEKYKALSEEVTRLQNLQQEEYVKGGKGDTITEISPGSAQVASEKVSGCSTRKRSRNSATETEDDIVTPPLADHNIAMPECCKGSLDANATASGTCLFQALIECLVGMKISTVDQTEGQCISALHQSSGYSFSLTWIKKAAGEESELLYRASSLGTFERVAPEWMRDVIMFSTNMCPTFFERVARVIKLHC